MRLGGIVIESKDDKDVLTVSWRVVATCKLNDASYYEGEDNPLESGRGLSLLNFPVDRLQLSGTATRFSSARW